MSKKFTYHIPVTVPSTKEVTPEDIYENCSINITPGWEVIDFRPPVVGDKFWGKTFIQAPKVLTYTCDETWSSPQTPRLILKKSQQTVNPNLGVSISIGDVYGPETIILPEGWKFERFGMPKNGEMVLSRYYKTHSSQKPVYEFYTNTHPNDILPRIIVTKA